LFLEENRVKIAEMNGVQLILLGMRQHAGDATVQANACHALAVIASTGRNVCSIYFVAVMFVDAKMHVHVTQIRGVATILQAMQGHPHSADVQLNACRVLANLALTSWAIT
jgi:hypothetical protein